MRNIRMIFGAPGCGKTTHLIGLLKDLLQTYRPHEIAFVSFTRKGSYEGRDRAIEEFGYTEKDFPFFRTIHSIAFRELGVSRYDMIGRNQYREFSRAMGMSFLGFYTEDLINNDDRYLFQVSLERNNPGMAETYAPDLELRKLNNVRRNYARYKKQKGVFDFDDLIENFNAEGNPLPVRVAIIDEAQDLTTLQWEFCRTAFAGCEAVYIAGDDDQAIYQWSGADVQQFLGFVENAEDMTVLDKSWRLKPEILEFSKRVVSNIGNRIEKDFSAAGGRGSVSLHNRLEDLKINSEQSYYFLARNNCFLGRYREHLQKKGLPFLNKGEIMPDKTILKLILKYERMRKEKKFDGILSDPYLSDYLKKTADPEKPWFDSLLLPIEDSNHFRSFFKNKSDIEKADRLQVNTIHGVKGGEADNVVLLLDVTRNVFRAAGEGRNTDSELRVLYVGCTRAKKNLHLVFPSSKFGYDKILPGGIGG